MNAILMTFHFVLNSNLRELINTHGIIIRAPSSATSSSPLFLRCVLSWHANNVSDGTNLCGRRDSLHLIIVRRPGRGLTEFRNMDSKDSDGSDSDMERHGYMAFNLAEGNLITRPKADDNPSDLSPCDEDATCLDKDSSLEGDHLTGVVDRMMQEISPKDSSNDMGNLATGIVDRIMADVSKEGGDSSVMRRPPSLFESTPIASDSAEEQHSPILSHMSRRPPSGPFVMGDQMDIMTEVFAGRIPEHTGSSLAGTFYPEHLPLHASAGQEQHPVVSQMLMEKIKWIQRNPEQGNSSLKKLMDYQTPSSRSMSRQQKVRTDLALREKVRLINMSETTGKSQRSLAAEFHISVGSVNNILRRKREYLEAFEKNEVPSTCKSFRFTRPPKRSGYDELHTLILKWIEKVKGKMKPLTWPIIIEKSREFAVKLNILNFNSSGLWVENLKRSIDIAVPLPEQSNMSDSDVKLLSMWRKMLPFLQQGYEPENIFTISETALYYKCLPDKCFITGATCKGCHHHSDVLENRLTILLCCNALGERLKPLVVSRHGSPASLSNIRMSDLPVGWCHQPNANMTAEIFASWLRGLDTAMGQQKRHIALFMDMTPSHLASTLLKNISLKFYLDDSSHLLQPLNQGVIQTLKAIYRRRLLQSILARTCSTDDCLSALEAVSELDAVFWIHEAWRNINSEIITTCFQAAAFPENKSSCSLDKSPVNLEFIPEDLPQLIEEIGQTFKFMPMSADIYSQFDSQLPCHQGDGEEWETTLLAETTGRNIKSEPDESSEIAAIGPLRPSVDDMGVLPEISPFEAMECLSKLKRFSSSNMGLLTTVFELESLLLDSMCPSQHATLQFQQSSYPGFSVAFPPFSSDLQ